MSISVPVRVVQRPFGETMRRDRWWVQPLVVFLGLSTFLVYSTWAAFQGEHYTFGPYLSPFYSPEIFGDSPHSWFGPEAGGVAGVAAVLAGAADPADPGPVPAHLLLLPRRVLQGVLGRPAVLHRRRAAVELLGRELVSAHPAERPSLHAVPRRSAVLVHPGVRRVEGAVVHRSGDRHGVVRHRRRHPRPGRERRAARRISLRLPFAAARRRRLRRSAVARAARPPRLRLRELPESPAHVWAWCSLFSVGFADLYVRLCSMGVWSDLRIF